MLAHGLQDLFFVEFGVGQAQLSIFRFAASEQLAGPDAEQADDFAQLRHARRLFEILDQVRLEAALAEQGQRLAALGAARIVKHGECHR